MGSGDMGRDIRDEDLSLDRVAALRCKISDSSVTDWVHTHSLKDSLGGQQNQRKLQTVQSLSENIGTQHLSRYLQPHLSVGINIVDEYDEWGNFIGDLSDDSDKGSEANDDDRHSPIAETLAPLPEPDEMNDMEVDHVGSSNAVVLHDDKKYYPLAMELYGPDVETMVEEEDAQPLTEPIINPIKIRKFTIVEKGEAVPETTFSKQFMADLMSHPESVRNVAVVGHLHHGKTALLDMLVHETHDFEWETSKPLLYTDTHILEQQHGAILVVDAVEGVLVSTDKIIRHLVQEGIPIVLVVNKVDRLILELRLPPADAYYKLKHTIEEVNTVISSCNPDPIHRVSPELGNVGFASTEMGWCFNLTSFAKMYRDTFCTSKKDLFDITAFAKRLWGNIWYIPEERKFVKRNVGGECKRTFDHFILEPLYKLYGQVLGSEQGPLKETLADLGIYLKPSAYKLDVRPLLRIVLSQFFGPSTGLVDMISSHVPNPQAAAVAKLKSNYTGPLDSPLAQHIAKSDPAGPLVIQITKLYPTHDANEFRSFGRVLSGVARAGVKVKVLGEGYSVDDEEDMVEALIERVFIFESRYSVETSGVPAGNLCLLSGIDNSITKTATVVESAYTRPGGSGEGENLYIFKPISHLTKSVLKIAVEPLNPSELPKLLEGLRKSTKKLLFSVKESIKQGFQWATREGPICDEPIRNVKFKLLDATLLMSPFIAVWSDHSNCSTCLLFFLHDATPRLMEPVYYMKYKRRLIVFLQSISFLPVEEVMSHRTSPSLGSPLYTVKAYIPVIDANGLKPISELILKGKVFVCKHLIIGRLFLEIQQISRSPFAHWNRLPLKL
ncbi:hypothetical protein KEM48_000913, partial [Puccinia striiformis f. sp. tritici PST-130]